MNMISGFEKFDIYSHLKDRGIDPETTRVIVDEESSDTYFFIYNFSGQLVGYQKYNPRYEKKGQNNLKDPKLAKYFNWISDEGHGKKIAVWGLESINREDKFMFVTEGIFDVARVHQSGYPGIATMCNDPSPSLRSWIATLPQTKIVIYDNDRAGMKLKSLGNHSFCVPSGKDLNDLSESEARNFLKDCLKGIRFK